MFRTLMASGLKTAAAAAGFYSIGVDETKTGFYQIVLIVDGDALRGVEN